MTVTLFAWIPHKVTSSKRHTLNASRLSCIANKDVA